MLKISSLKKNLRYILLGFIVSLITTIIICVLFYDNLNSLKSYNANIEHTQKVIDKIENVQFLLTEAENSQRGYVITKDPSYKSYLIKVQKTIYSQLDELESLITNHERQIQLLIKLRSTIVKRVLLLNETVDKLGNKDGNMFFTNTIRGRKIMVDFNILAKQMEDEEFKLMNERKKQKATYENESPMYLLFILIASIIFQIGSFIIISRELKSRYTYQKQLERNINELNMSHAELEQIAFIASHDLQEPLRKMRTFSGRLLLLFKDKLDQEGTSILNKLDSAARRMQGLIQDVVDYISLINSEEPQQSIDLNALLFDVQNNLQKTITSKNVVITVAELPEITGYPFQVQLLFTNLIHNSIKFSREGIPPEVNITGEKIRATNPFVVGKQPTEEQYLKIKVTDNGIGFENEFAKKIFVMFQRLHNQQSNYEGKGIGLAISKRVMSNHNGFISADGELGKGATFNLYFPI